MTGEHYLRIYDTYKNWKTLNNKSLPSSEENNSELYVTEWKEKLKPPTLRNIWSMLRKIPNTISLVGLNFKKK